MLYFIRNGFLILLFLLSQAISDTLFHTMQIDGRVSKVLTNATDMTINAHGEIYVSTQTHIKKYDISGVLIAEWEKPYNEVTTYLSKDSADNLYALYPIMGKVVQYDSNGSILSSWNTVSDATDMIIDTHHTFFILDAKHVFKYQSDGTFIKEWGSSVSHSGEFENATNIALDRHNNVYVIDEYGYNIQKFDTNGTFLKKWDIQGNSLVIDNNDDLYILNQSNHKVYKYNQNGTKLLEFGNSEQTKEGICAMSKLSLLHNNYLYISSSLCNWIQTFDLEGNFIQKWGSYGYTDEEGKFSLPSDVVTDNEGNLYVADNSHIQKFDRFGHFILHWGDSYDVGSSQLMIDSSNHIYTFNGDIKKFDSDGHFLSKLDYSILPEGLSSSNPIAIDSHNIFYAISNNQCHIIKFDTSGYLLGKWGECKSDSGDFSEEGEVFDILIDSADRVYVSEAQEHKIYIFDDNGTLLSQWVFENTITPYTLALDENRGYMYFKNGNHSIIKCTLNGQIVEQWGNNQFIDGENEFYAPKGVTVDTYSNVYVADTQNHRIQKKDSTQTIPPINQSHIIGSIIPYLLF